MYVETVVEPVVVLDEEIDSSPALLDRLLSISKSVRAVTGLELSAIGLDVGQDQFLHVIDSRLLSTCEVARILNVRPSTVSKMADRLVAKGLIERQGDQRDFRRTLLCLTPEGTKKRRQVHEVWSRIETHLEKCDPSIREAKVDAVLDVVDAALAKQLMRIR
jgi:DNA-binding MarR family transcriptional regulator